MYAIFTYIWVIDGVNVRKYTIHGSSGIGSSLLLGLVVSWKLQVIFSMHGLKKIYVTDIMK